MRTKPLQMLTWGTIATAISSAAWLSSTSQAAVFCSVSYRATSKALGIELPVEPARDTPATVPVSVPAPSAGSTLAPISS